MLSHSRTLNIPIDVYLFKETVDEANFILTWEEVMKQKMMMDNRYLFHYITILSSLEGNK
jgi:hypothetical protein